MFSKLLTWAKKSLVILKLRKISDRDFTIISSNCTGTLPYRFLNLPYTSPTVNLFFFAEDYLKFVSRLDFYLSCPLRFASESRFDEGNTTRDNHGWYPIGKLDDIEIHFMHYHSETEALEKWNRRKRRINRDKLILAFTDRDLCTEEHLKAFDELPHPNKFVLTARHWPEIKSSIQVPRWQHCDEIGDAYTHYDALLHLDFNALYQANDRQTTAVQSGSENQGHRRKSKLAKNTSAFPA